MHMYMHTGKHKFVCMLNAQASWFLLGGPPHHHSQPIHKVWSSQPTMELAEGKQMTECARVKTCPPACSWHLYSREKKVTTVSQTGFNY